MDFYLYQPDDHRPCYFYYFLRRRLVLHEYEGIFTEFLRFIGTGATKPSLFFKVDKLSSMQFTM